MCGLRDISQSTVETANSDVGSTSPYGIDCEDGVVGAIDANGTVTGVLPGHWAGAPVDETNANVTRVWVCETPEACLGGADSVCRTGHEGVLCAGCLPGYTRSMARLCVPFDADEQSVALGAAVLSVVTLLFSALLGLAIALLCCRLARPPKPPIVPPWMEKNGDTVKSSESNATNPSLGSHSLIDRQINSAKDRWWKMSHESFGFGSGGEMSPRDAKESPDSMGARSKANLGTR